MKSVRDALGQHFVRFSKDTWKNDLPESLKNSDHVEHDIYIGRYQGNDPLDKDYTTNLANWIVLDPGVKVPLTGFVPGSRMVVAFSPNLAPYIKKENFDIAKCQSALDTIINGQDSVKDSQAALDAAHSSYTDTPTTALLEAYEDQHRQHHALRKSVRDSLPDLQGLDTQITKCQDRIRRAVDKFHNSANWFLSQFSVVMYPKFSADQSRLSQKKSNILAKTTKSVMSWMAHGRQRTKLIRAISFKGGVIVDPSESCSTLLGSCCGTMSSPGIQPPSFTLSL